MTLFIFNLCCLALLFVAASAFASLPTPEALIVYLQNGNFEEKPDPRFLKKSRIIGKYSLLKWEINGFVEYISGGPQLGEIYFPVTHGEHAVRLGKEASISQTIMLKLGYCCMLFNTNGHQVPQQIVMDVGETFKRILEEGK